MVWHTVWLGVKVSDGSQPPMTFDWSLSESAGSHSSHRFVRPCVAHATDSVSARDVA